MSALNMFSSRNEKNVKCIFCLVYKGIWCGHPFELAQYVDAIQISTHNICSYKEKSEKQKTKKKKKKNRKKNIV